MDAAIIKVLSHPSNHAPLDRALQEYSGRQQNITNMLAHGFPLQ